MNIPDLRINIDNLRSDLTEEKIRLGMLKKEYKSNLTSMSSIECEALNMERVAMLLQKTAEHQRSYVCGQIETICTTALQYVYGADYALELELKQDKKTASCEVWVTERVGNEILRFKPQDSKGGGVSDIVSVALRFALIQVYNSPDINGPVLLDEPGKMVSKEYSALLSDFLITLSDQLDRQLIVITHNEFMAESANTIFKAKKIDGVSMIEMG